MKRLIGLVLVGSLALVVAGNAGAVPPVHSSESFDYGGSSSCGTFADVYTGHLDIGVTTTLDKAGNPVRDVVHFNGWETNYRSDLPSVSITGHRSFNVIFEYQTGVERDVGNVYTQTAPGQGVLFHDVGSVIFAGGEITIHGPHDVLEQGDAAFCNALRAVTPS